MPSLGHALASLTCAPVLPVYKWEAGLFNSPKELGCRLDCGAVFSGLCLQDPAATARGLQESSLHQLPVRFGWWGAWVGTKRGPSAACP